MGPTARSCTRSTPGARRACGPGCACARAGVPRRAARSPTSSASSRRRADERAREEHRHADAPGLRVHRPRRPRRVPEPDRSGPPRRAALPAVPQGLLPAERRLRALRRRHLGVGRRGRPRHGHHLLHRARALGEHRAQAPLLRRQHPARRLGPRLHRPPPGMRGRRRTHRHARRGRVAASQRVDPHLREHPLLPPERGARRPDREARGVVLMRDVAILSFAQTPMKRRENTRTEVDMVMSVVQTAVSESGLGKREIGFTCSGSSDYIAGQAFAFVGAVDALGAWPPISESHVEMDGAWALYEAWIKIQTGVCDSALAFGFGRASMGTLPETLTLQLEPYTLAPLGIDAIGMAALQARAWLEATGRSEREMAEVAARSRRDAKQNPCAQLRGDFEVEKLLAEPTLASPLRKHDCPPVSDGAAAVVIAAAEVARRAGPRPVWIRGIDHRIEPHRPGVRDLTRSPSAPLAAPLDVAELHAPFTHQELILRDALGLGPRVRINPSGGALAANPMMVAGLVRLGEAAAQVRSGRARRALAHATQGHCLQQNLVCWLEGE